MAMQEYSTFAQAPGLEPHHQMDYCHIRGTHWEGPTLFTNPTTRAGYDTRSIFNFSCLTKAEEPSLPYYLLIAGGRIFGFIPFPRILVLYEMQSASSRMWTRIAVSISYDIIPRAPPLRGSYSSAEMQSAYSTGLKLLETI